MVRDCRPGEMRFFRDVRHPHTDLFVFKQRQEDMLPGFIAQGREYLLIAFELLCQALTA